MLHTWSVILALSSSALWQRCVTLFGGLLAHRCGRTPEEQQLSWKSPGLASVLHPLARRSLVFEAVLRVDRHARDARAYPH